MFMNFIQIIYFTLLKIVHENVMYSVKFIIKNLQTFYCIIYSFTISFILDTTQPAGAVVNADWISGEG